MSAETDPTKYVSLEVSDPHYAAIGLVSCNWAKLERTVDHAIWELVQAHPPVTACVTAQLIGFAPRIRTVQALHSELGGDETDHRKLRALLNDCHKIQQDRNRVVHDPWYYNPAHNVRARYAATTSSDGKPVMAFIAVTLEELAKLSEQIARFEARTYETLEGILEPFREKSPQWFSVGPVE